MAYLLIIVCGLLSCTKVTIQGRLAKGNIENAVDSALANCFVFFFTAILFSVSLRNGINFGMIWYAALFGLFSASFQIFYALALKSGPFSATCMLINLGMVIPVVFSFFVFHEKITIIRVVGVILCLLALFLNTKNDGKKIHLKWLVYVALAFCSTGGVSTMQKVFAKSQFAGSLETFIFLGYTVAFLITLFIISVQRATGQERNFKINKKTMTCVLAIAACLGAFQYVSTFANSFIDAIVLNPSISGLATIFQMVSARIIFKEKFTVKQICSICIGIVAILLISL